HAVDDLYRAALFPGAKGLPNAEGEPLVDVPLQLARRNEAIAAQLVGLQPDDRRIGHDPTIVDEHDGVPSWRRVGAMIDDQQAAGRDTDAQLFFNLALGA